ncbi:P-loop containing nucleoside triphosphate hydrolase protein [Lasiosphaeris hirsuta]|uniref:RNA helicase n=1 Tax=Lasiosphaeris hirsuta TaxID=260670 RepID=A0AA40DT03_9PEZI|nr:P-loop containing nucleoside triphosphate hydrolase protein [Lasiosphaeris hirsuta]
MAPSQKRKQTANDDFILTIPDEADIPEEETVVAAAPPKKKAKTTNKKKNKKGKKFDDNDGNSAAEGEEEESPIGIWGQNDDDDGAMDSDFEFVVPDAAKELDPADFDGWGFEGAKKGMVPGNEKQAVDIDEIIRRRREKREAKELRKNSGEAPAAAPAEEAEAEEDAMDFDLDDDNDEVLAEDAFGMGVGSDVDEGEDQEMADKQDEEDSEEEENSDEYEDEHDDAASDNDSVATPVQHPDDDGSDSEEEEDAEEEAKRRDFFAPEEKEVPGKSGGPATFQGMSLSRPILRGLATVGFTKPTPIQAKTIPISLMGKDVVGGAVTGSGKTAAFVVPILERLLYRPKKVPTTRVVIMTPTRELAIQCHSVAVKLASHTDIKFCLAVGGLSLKIQEAELRLRPDVVIATPGRFIDHMRNSASFTTDTVEILVLDEADRMLEDGFADELNEILTTLPKSRQTMLFSATMTSSVDSLIRVGLNKPARIMVDTKKKTVMTLTQEFVRLRPGREEKRMGYLVHICKNLYHERVVIFFRQKKIAHQCRIIFGVLGLSSAELHGSLNQAQRIASVEAFRDGKVSYLLATDLASRGLDIKGIDTVINYEAPQSLDIYVHRVGRTARAGRSGVAITLAAEPDRKVVKGAVRAGKAQGSKIISRVIEAAEADKWQDQIDEMEDEIEAIMQEEKEEKQIAQVEMQVKKGENLIKHEEEIQSRPRRTWFETEKDKKDAKEAGRAELNGVREKLKKKGEAGRLSNKDKKKLDSIAERGENKSWKKGRAERDGKGAVLNFKKGKSDKLKTKPPPSKVAGPAKKAFRGKKR